jgi:uncharacterized membrane protein
MHKTHLKAFSDGVLAIILTIMVLELKVPHGAGFAALRPVFLSYLLSFVYVGIYWNNHHHLLSGTRQVSGGVLWANLHLLFWLSLVPFATGWMGENHFAPATLAVYGSILLGAAIAYFILQNCIIAVNGPDSPLAYAVGATGKRQALAGALLRGHRQQLLDALGGGCGLCDRGADVAGTRPAHRAHPDSDKAGVGAARHCTPGCYLGAHSCPTVGRLAYQLCL